MGIARPRSLTALATDEIRRQIVEGELQLGEALSEAKLAARLEVSRTPVREAFARLELEGLVRTEPQRGTFVFSLARGELQDICDVRVSLETMALRRALERDPKKLAEELEAVCEEMKQARDRDDTRRYLHLDTLFHDVLLEQSRNSFLVDAYQMISAKMAALRNRLGDHTDHMDKSFKEHLQIAELAKRQDARAAEEVLIGHIGRKEGSYWNLTDGSNARRLGH